MFNLIIILSMILLISNIMYLINMILSKKNKNNREKMSPLECGFNSMNSMTMPFSIQFYYISILFLIFDIEIILILPMIQKLNYMLIFKWMIMFLLIMIILIIGFYFEWWNNLLYWI